MSSTVARPAVRRHRNSLDALRPRMAKAVNKIDIRRDDWRFLIGQAVRRCFALAGVSQKEAADLVNRDVAQIARWVSAVERPQLDALFANERLRQPLTQALAEMSGAEVEITVRMRRTS